jgi:hypothetical protein
MFLTQLSEAIRQAKGDQYPMEAAEALAAQVWKDLLEMGMDAFPCMVEREEIRFVYQWDETPPILTVMLWNDVNWQDIARVVVPMSE